jgi:hypothetical protein
VNACVGTGGTVMNAYLGSIGYITDVWLGIGSNVMNVY